MAKAYLCSLPTFGPTNRRTGIRYIYSLDELRVYQSELIARGITWHPRWTAAGRAALQEAP